MAYIGNPPTVGQWRKLDDISGSFNGATTTFTTSVGGSNVTAGSANQLFVSLGGVIQQPNVDYSVTTNSIIFTTAPASGLDFFAVLAGDALNAGTPGDGTVTTAKLAGNLTVDLDSGSAATPSLTFDPNTGLYSPGSDQVGISTGGTSRITVDASGNVAFDTSTLYVDAANNRVGVGTTSPGVALHVDGDIRADGIYGETDTNTSIQFPGSDVITFNEGGSEAARIDSSARLLVGTSSARTNFFNTSFTTRQQLEGTNTATSSSALIANFNGVGGEAYLIFAKSRGSAIGSNTLVQSGDSLGTTSFMGSDGSEFVEAASIKAVVDGTPGANDMPGRLVFSTTADGASSPTERMRITSTGQMRLAGAGITFNGDTATANELDDYEEGTWTVTNPSATDTSTYYGAYTKIGDFVVVTVTATTVAGAVLNIDANAGLSGCPFATSALTGSWGVYQWGASYLNVASGTAFTHTRFNQRQIRFSATINQTAPGSTELRFALVLTGRA